MGPALDAHRPRNRPPPLHLPLRAPVERVFALWKRCYGYRRVRYRSLARNAAQLGLLAIATNLRRALLLT